MKIDLLRKLPEHMDTLVLLLDSKSKVDDIDHLPSHFKESIEAYVKKEEFKPEYAKIKSFHSVYKGQVSNIILCGAGVAAKLTADKLRRLFADITRSAIRLKATNVYLFPSFAPPIGDTQYGHVLAEAALMTEYKFTKYLSQEKPHAIGSLHLALNVKSTRYINRGIIEGRLYAEVTNLARNLVNEPANVIYPETLAEAAKKAALKYGFSIDVYPMDRIRRLKMEAFLAVGKGSKAEPKLIVMRHMGNPDAKNKTIGLIGKGLTYDSGGYCLKPPQSMLNMKNDMAGSAAVIGAMCAAATLKLKVNIVAVVAACENMISGEAYHTGDLLRTMSGKTIEVINTDAEGRLTLVDAIHYAITKEKVDKILDIATLTGAAVGALGTEITPVVTNDDAWLAKLETASEFTGEAIWRLPAHENYNELIKSQIADLKNTGGPFAGTITAALFIREFVGNKPWIHLDIAGTALRDKESGMYSVGATGVGVRLITQLLREMA
ncbi:MAG: leucyl aminopeptidase [Candidatus Cloacimonetes bacterium]|nr:leucyl aminopeptidase [Candidatus Cloacimonadota bacterium]